MKLLMTLGKLQRLALNPCMSSYNLKKSKPQHPNVEKTSWSYVGQVTTKENLGCGALSTSKWYNGAKRI